jgi:hypothetical protein
MRSSNFFWGGILIVLGSLFLVDSLGIIDINFWHIFWPLMLILFGVWLLIGYFFRGDPIEGEEASVPIEGSLNAKVTFHHGAGQLRVSSGAQPTELFSGTFGGGLNHKTSRDGETARVTLRVRDIGFPIVIPWLSFGNNNMNWDVKFTKEIPLDLILKTGASDTHLDLRDLQVTSLRVETGASATQIELPEVVSHTKVVIKSGVASVKVNVPDKVAARIRVTGGLIDANVDRNRFPKTGGYYVSPDYESAENKVDIRAEGGVGSVMIQ